MLPLGPWVKANDLVSETLEQAREIEPDRLEIGVRVCFFDIAARFHGKVEAISPSLVCAA
jgi:hypothetical protein